MRYLLKDDDSEEIFSGDTPEALVKSLRSPWGFSDNSLEGFAERAKLMWGITLSTESAEAFVESAIAAGVLIPVDAQ